MKRITVCVVVACLFSLSAHIARCDAPTYTQVERLIQSVDSTGGGSVINVGSVADEKTVTTTTSHGASTQGQLGIYGASTAAEGSTPFKNADGTLSWSRFSPVNTLRVSGVGGGTTTTAVCTNSLTFVSDPESNVRFTVTGDGAGNVTVSVGVYYK